MAWPKSGHDALIYISAGEIDGANAWTLDVPSDTVEVVKFGDDWVATYKTFNRWSGGHNGGSNDQAYEPD